jgi:hypothetical protein
LTGRALNGLEMKSSDWSASASDVRRTLAGDAVRPLRQMEYHPEKIRTYFFKTRDGAFGVLQLLKLAEEPRGILIRYKTVLTPTPIPSPLKGAKN